MTVNITLDIGVVMPTIGVGNLMPNHPTALRERPTTVPAVNRIEVHPYLLHVARRSRGPC